MELMGYDTTGIFNLLVRRVPYRRSGRAPLYCMYVQMDGYHGRTKLILTYKPINPLTLSHPMTPYGIIMVSHKLMGIYIGFLILDIILYIIHGFGPKSGPIFMRHCHLLTSY